MNQLEKIQLTIDKEPTGGQVLARVKRVESVLEGLMQTPIENVYAYFEKLAADAAATAAAKTAAAAQAAAAAQGPTPTPPAGSVIVNLPNPTPPAAPPAPAPAAAPADQAPAPIAPKGFGPTSSAPATA